MTRHPWTTATSWATSILLAALIAVLLSWAGPALDDHSGEWAQAADLQTAINTAVARQRFEAAAQQICGPQAAWQELPDGSVQCKTKYGRPTITVRVSP